ncbi:WxL domain-containing protein [Enterococcus rivorum]|uniref:WxL domain-containing protein n=2 Tax=Enterococcus rivorum TaxID=762845 RepID=A0A1E5KSA0_9ENTE|nr:WxL domain-containing protein [Enterococcus rivorum]MBP2097417.1 hypothetical protein [Enterococcus rivorum]OEH80765.1 hypothetical protein BCR26_07105 [Enterococcus rivorum]
MKKNHWILSLVLLTTGLMGVSSSVYAETKEAGEMGISFQGLIDPNYGIVDPENPKSDLKLDGEYGHSTGPLRIDFVPSLSFSRNKIATDEVSYASDALVFKEMLACRGQFIQVSDYREKQTGWSLQVRQETQFTNQKKADSQLDGAVLSFDNSWVNTRNGTSQPPDVSKEVIRLSNIGETYTLAKADKGTGGGTWSVSFGASMDYEDATSTVKPRLDEQGKAIIDATNNNQAVFMNQAVRLTIPSGTKKEAGTYKTVLTWIISELP